MNNSKELQTIVDRQRNEIEHLKDDNRRLRKALERELHQSELRSEASRKFVDKLSLIVEEVEKVESGGELKPDDSKKYSNRVTSTISWPWYLGTALNIFSLVLLGFALGFLE